MEAVNTFETYRETAIFEIILINVVMLLFKNIPSLITTVATKW